MKVTLKAVGEMEEGTGKVYRANDPTEEVTIDPTTDKPKGSRGSTTAALREFIKQTGSSDDPHQRQREKDARRLLESNNEEEGVTRSMTTEQAHQILERNGINPDAIKSIVMDVLKGSDGDGLTAKQKLENMSSEELNKLYDRRAELTEDEERILSLADQQARQSSLGRRPEQPGGGERWDDY